jgi:hypothetical protein
MYAKKSFTLMPILQLINSTTAVYCSRAATETIEATDLSRALVAMLAKEHIF